MTFPVLFGALAFGIQHPRTSKNIAFSIIDQIYEPKVREDHFNQLKQIPATVKQNTVDKAQQSLTKWADGVQEYLDKNWLNKKE